MGSIIIYRERGCEVIPVIYELVIQKPANSSTALLEVGILLYAYTCSCLATHLWQSLSHFGLATFGHPLCYGVIATHQQTSSYILYCTMSAHLSTNLCKIQVLHPHNTWQVSVLLTNWEIWWCIFTDRRVRCVLLLTWRHVHHTWSDITWLTSTRVHVHRSIYKNIYQYI